MRYLIFLLFPIISFAQVNMWTYDTSNGGNNNGVLEQSEVQSALDNEVDLIVDPLTTITISSRIDIDQSFSNIIDWNGSTIIASTNINPMILVNKRTSNGGLTTMIDLKVDGNEVATRGFTIQSRVDFNNIDAFSFRQPTSSSPAGMVIEIYQDNDAYGNWSFNRCDIYDLVGASNGITTDSWGAANGYIVYWKVVPSSPVTITIKNASLHDSWGEDAGLLYFLDQTGTHAISGSTSGIIVDNLQIYDVERRNVKGFSGNVTYLNSTFTDPLPTNPNLYSSNKSGLFVVAGDAANQASGIVVNNCTFVSRGYDGRVIPAQVDGVTFANCSFVDGADIAFSSTVGDVTICNSDFGIGSIIYDYYGGQTQNDVGQITLDINNTYIEGNPITVDSYSYIETTVVCITTTSAPELGGSSTPNNVINATSGMLISH